MCRTVSLYCIHYNIDAAYMNEAKTALYSTEIRVTLADNVGFHPTHIGLD